jgi:hypothetical protein
MTYNWIKKTIVSAAPLVLAGAPALAQGISPLDLPEGENKNHFRISYRMAFNLSASFKNLGGSAPGGHQVPGQGLQPANPGPATGGGINRTYEDGFNWVDSTGNAFGYTRYWGYDSSSQIVGNSIVMHSTTVAAASSNDRGNDPQPGFELTYSGQLMHQGKMRGGLEVAFGYTFANIRDRTPLTASGTRVSDAFALPPSSEGGFVIPPTAPYSGTYELAENGNPVISDSPVRTTEAVMETIQGKRRFEADIFGFKVGPYVDFDLGRWTLGLSGGFVLAYVDSDLKVSSTTLTEFIQTTQTDGGRHNDFLPGAYVAGNVAYAISDQWSLFGSIQFQDAGKYTQHGAVVKATLDLSETVFAAVGLSYNF